MRYFQSGANKTPQALAYYYIRTLIYRPAVGSSLGPKSAPALLSVAGSSKHIIQILQLLEERSMTFTFCMNKTDLLVLCGMTLLYQSIDLKNDSKVMRDDERLVNVVVKMLDKSQVSGALDFKRVASQLVALEEPIGSPMRSSSREASMPAPSNRGSPPAGAGPKQKNTPYVPLGQLPGAAFSESDLVHQQEKLRRMTMPAGTGPRPEFFRSRSRQSFDNVQAEGSMAHRDHRMSMSQIANNSGNVKSSPLSRPNLDFMPFGNSGSQPSSPQQHRMQMQPGQVPHPNMVHSPMAAAAAAKGVSSTEWETLLGSLDGGLNNVYDAIYGGNPMVNEASITVSNCGDWPPDNWDLTGFSIGDFGNNPEPPQSVLSMSDESLSSGEEVGPSELGLSVGSVDYRNQMMPQPHMMDRMETTYTGM